MSKLTREKLTLAELDDLSMRANPTDGYDELSQKGPTQEEIIKYNRTENVWKEAMKQNGGQWKDWYDGLTEEDKKLYHDRLTSRQETKRDRIDGVDSTTLTGIQTNRGTTIGTYRDKQRVQKFPKTKVTPTEIWVSLSIAAISGFVIGLISGRLL